MPFSIFSNSLVYFTDIVTLNLRYIQKQKNEHFKCTTDTMAFGQVVALWKDDRLTYECKGPFYNLTKKIAQ